MKKIIVEVKKKSDTLKILALSYSWVILACSLIFLLLEDVTTGIGVFIRGLIFLCFMYNKNNWRVVILILSILGVFSAISSLDNIWYLLDIAGNIAVFMYALKERK